eukprot:scaffold71225_cov38-Cyclotella_meneghiniana.AAC.6
MQECKRQTDLAAANDAEAMEANESMQQIQEIIFLEAEMEEEVHILAEYHECDHQRDLAAASEAELTKATDAELDAILAATQLEKDAARERYFEVTETVQKEIEREEVKYFLEVEECEQQGHLVAASEAAAKKEESRRDRTH